MLSRAAWQGRPTAEMLERHTPSRLTRKWDFMLVVAARPRLLLLSANPPPGLGDKLAREDAL